MDEPAIQVSDYPEWIYQSVDTPCPDCGKKELVKYARANRGDDYVIVYECKNCHSEWD